jgi:outer membrane protein assembly factor BamB
MLVLFAAPCFGSDWPQFLGPNRNGISTESLASSWDVQAPKQLWKKAVGSGFSGPVVTEGRVLLFHRRDGVEILEAFDAQDGRSQWRNEGATAYRDDFGFDDGPRAVPCVSGGRAYAMGAEGLIRCVELASGRTLWTVSTKDQFKAAKGFFGMVCSPLVDDGRVIVNVGGHPGAGIIALDAQTGKLRWKSRDD